MATTRKLIFPLTDHVDTSAIEHLHDFESEGSRIALAWASITDNFDNSAIDAIIWGTDTVNGGSIVETTQLDIVCDATNKAAILYRQVAIDKSRTETYKIKFRINTFAASDVNAPLILIQQVAASTVNNTVFTSDHSHIAFTSGASGAFYLRYVNTSNQDVYWNGAIWTTTTSSPYTINIATEYVLVFETNSTQWRYSLKSADELTTHATTAWVNWSSTRNKALPYWLTSGDINNSSWTTNITITKAIVPAYSTSSPSPATVWTALGSGDVVDMSTAKVWRFKDGVVITSLTDTDVQFKYAANGGADSAAKTLSALRAESDITVTDATQSFKVYGVYASDGSYKSESDAFISVDVLTTDAGGGGGMIMGS